MGELLDRRFQRELLEDIAAVYPQAADIQLSYGTQTDNRLLVNLTYLDEHGLVAFKRQKFLDNTIKMHSVTITAKGLDFLAGDGGLSAVLGVVTVKLHDDTIRQLLIHRIEGSTGDKSIKDQLIAKVKGLPAELLGKVLTTGLDKALETAPDTLSLLQDMLSQSGA